MVLVELRLVDLSALETWIQLLLKFLEGIGAVVNKGIWYFLVGTRQYGLLQSPTLHAYHLCPLHQSLSLLNFKHSLQIDTKKVRCDEFYDYSPYYCDANNNPISEAKINSWNSSTDCCSWKGVICDEFTGKVIELDLSQSRLTGVIDSNSSIFQLSHLRRLNLAYNALYSSKISPVFQRLIRLSHLNLTGSDFSGEVPSEISQLNELVSLDLSYCAFVFLNPHVFRVILQNMTRLRELFLPLVNISSSLPNNLSSSLTVVDFSRTNLKGAFPYHIFHLPNVQQISLSYNSFDYFVSSESVKWNASSSLQKLELAEVVFPRKLLDMVGNLNQLTYLDLYSCELNGTLPQSFGNLTQISHLDLSFNNFSGTIPLQILSLERLTFLNLWKNHFTSIPHFASNNMKMLKTLILAKNKLNASSVSSILSNLSQLEFIDVSDNPLYKMPSELFELSSLQQINLERTQLYGPLPNSFSNLVNLQYLSLASNNISGPIETKTLSNLINLKYLNLQSNNFSGPIIEKRIFSKLVNLMELDLRSNNFSGPIEIDALFNLINLTILDLSSNNFGTTLDVKFLSRFESMVILDLSSSSLTLINEDNTILPIITIDYLRLGSCNIMDLDILRSIEVQRQVYLPNNKIHGEIPEWVWSNWSNIRSLDLSDNFVIHIGSKIPLQSLHYLKLRSNLLNGQLPILPHDIVSLDLSNNQLHGKIKPSICELRPYMLLDLSNNSFTGALPHCFGMMDLKFLDLHMNNLQGTIPDTLSMDSNLESLNLRGNHFEGKVPRSLSNCSLLKFLDLSKNNLNGTFPIWLGDLPYLKALSLRSNKLYGSIPFLHVSSNAFSHLQILDLSYNQLSGNLPASLFERLSQMMSANETSERYNNYFGDGNNGITLEGNPVMDYHDSMTMVLNGNVMQLEKILEVMAIIDLSCNHFEGEIPNSIGGLIAIQQLNLSHNNFTGQIPPQIGDLSNLHSLDLSSNQLDGHIPDKFAALGFLAVMNVSYNHLTGPIPSGTQLQSFSNASYMGNDGLCGLPLSRSCGNHESPHHGLPDDREFFDGFSWQSVVVGYCVGICIGLVIGSLMLFNEKPKWLTRIVQEEAYRMILKYKATNGSRHPWNRRT